jgi:hypothetical protein
VVAKVSAAEVSVVLAWFGLALRMYTVVTGYAGVGLGPAPEVGDVAVVAAVQLSSEPDHSYSLAVAAQS